MTNPWTPERERKLTELWMAGMTRAQVAEALGPPITESAVKGKVRRLGLKRDAASITGTPAPKRQRAAANPARSAKPATGSATAGQQNKSKKPAAPANRATVDLVDVATTDPDDALSLTDTNSPGALDHEDATQAAANAFASTPTSTGAGPGAQSGSSPGGVADAQIRAPGTVRAEASGNRVHDFRFPGYNECHWPHGEPDNPDFEFCLAPVVPGQSYCEEHAEQAYRKKGG